MRQVENCQLTGYSVKTVSCQNGSSFNGPEQPLDQWAFSQMI